MHFLEGSLAFIRFTKGPQPQKRLRTIQVKIIIICEVLNHYVIAEPYL